MCAFVAKDLIHVELIVDLEIITHGGIVRAFLNCNGKACPVRGQQHSIGWALDWMERRDLSVTILCFLVPDQLLQSKRLLPWFLCGDGLEIP